MKVSIITQSFIIKQALTKSFETNFPNIEITTGKDAIKDINIEDKPVVILDCEESNTANLEQLEYLSSKNIRVVVLDRNKSQIFCKRVIQIGVDGYITDVASEEEFTYIMNKILSGSKFFDSQIIQDTLNNVARKTIDILTNRETQVVNLVSKGLNNKDIAQALKVSECTIKKHVSNILEKLDFKSRQDIIIYIKDNYKIG